MKSLISMCLVALVLFFVGCGLLRPIQGPTVYLYDTARQVVYDTVLKYETGPTMVKLIRDSVWLPLQLDTAKEIRLAAVPGDNWSRLQSAINLCQLTGCTIKLAAGTYFISQPLLVANWINGSEYGQSFVDIEGPTNARNTPAGACAVLRASFNDAPLFVLQQAKGCTIKNLMMIGQYTKSASFNYLQVDTLRFNDWLDGKCASNRSSPYAAVCIDPFSAIGYFDSTHTIYPRLATYYFPQMGRAGSTDVTIEGCNISCFVVGIMLTCAWQYNAEMITLRKSQINNCVSAFATTQAQAKMNVVEDCMFWGGVHTIIDGYNWGFGHGDGMTLPYVNRINIAGYNHELVSARPTNFQATFNEVYAEGLFKIGDFGPSTAAGMSGATAYYTRSGVVISNSMFDFQTQDKGIPYPDFFIQGEGVNFIGTTLRIYNGNPATGRLIFVDNLMTFRDGVFGLPPVIQKIIPTNGPRPLLLNMRDYNNPYIKLTDTSRFFTQGGIGGRRLTVDRIAFNGYLLDPSRQLKLYDFLLTSRVNDEGIVSPVLNLAYPIGVVSSITGDTVRFENMGMGWHNGDSTTVYFDRLK